MTYPHAIVVSAALLAGAVLMTARVESQSIPQPIAGVSATYDVENKVAVGWSIDPKSSQMRACRLEPVGSATAAATWAVKCYQP
jgi:hypothetical protein